MTTLDATPASLMLDNLTTRLLRDPRRLRRGISAMVAMGLAYTIVCINLAVIGGIPSPVPFLAIPSAEYFFWASFFYAPALLAGWLFGAAVTQLIARALGGTGSFEDTLALLGYATAVATVPALVPDLMLTLVQVFGWMEYGPWYESVHGGGAWFWIVWVYLIAYGVAFVVLYPAVVRTVHRLTRARAAITGIAGFVAYQGFILLFIR